MGIVPIVTSHLTRIVVFKYKYMELGYLIKKVIRLCVKDKRCHVVVVVRYAWVRRDALVQRTGTTSLYTGQRYDPKYCELVRGGWSHDHCEICWWTLSEGGDEEHSVGYTDGGRWICSECYGHFIETKA